MGITQGPSGGDLGRNFYKPSKDEELYILQREHYQKSMPYLVMLDFQSATMAFPTESTFATQASEVWEVGEEMEIDSRGAVIEVGT